MDLNNRKIKNHTAQAIARTYLQRSHYCPKQWMNYLAKLVHLLPIHCPLGGYLNNYFNFFY